MVRVVRFIILLLIILAVNQAYAISTSNLISQVNKFFKDIRSYKGEFELYNGSKLSRGRFVFMQPSFFKMVFYDKSSIEKEKKRIISNGKTLWIYYPDSPFGPVVIEQDLKGSLDLSITVPAHSLGIRRIIKDYNIKSTSGNHDLKSVNGLSDKVYILELTGKSNKYGFKSLSFYIRQDGFILKTIAKNHANKGGKKFIFIRKNVVLNPIVVKKEFRREVPKEARIIRNPFVSGRGY